MAPVFIHVETVGVFHDEFAPSHESESGPYLIPELGLDLVEIDGHLFVGMDFFSDEIGDDLFMGGSETGIPVMPVFESQEFFSVVIPSTGFLPQFGGLHRGHEDLDGARAVHFLPDDLFHSLDAPETGGKIGVDSGSQLSDHSCANHQLVADHFGIGRHFFLCRDEIL